MARRARTLGDKNAARMPITRPQYLGDFAPRQVPG